MKNSQKGFIVPLLLGIIALLVIGGGVYIYTNKKVETPAADNEIQQSNQVQQTNTQSSPSVTSQNQTPQQPSSVPVSETANWKTCRNVKYGYELKYPSTWKVWEPGSGNDSISSCETGLSQYDFSSASHGAPFMNLLSRDQVIFKGTVFEGVTSLSDYFSRNPLILGNRATTESLIDGEKLVRSENRLYTFHNGSVYNISSILTTGFATAVDALMALKEYCLMFREQLT